MQITANDVRRKFLKFYANRGHAVIPSASLIPENDPTTLFVGSGMQPLVPYLIGTEHPKGNRITNSQKAFRADDIEEVGDNRHTTFFEMLGNWSLGDYFKAEQLPWIYEFLTKEIGLDPKKIFVTVFEGDTTLKIPQDAESIALWKKIFLGAHISNAVGVMGSEEEGYARGMHEGERIFTYNATKNWWSRSGIPENMPNGEIGGPDSEIFYDFGTPHDTAFGAHCHPNCDCGRFLEIGNSVFMEYIKENGSFKKLPQKNVDFGGGLERITAAANNEPDIFLVTNSLKNTITTLETVSGIAYTESLESFRIIADHLRGVVCMLADGVMPSNTEQGYFARRLLRRSALRLHALAPEATLTQFVPEITTTYKEQYPELFEQTKQIQKIIATEENQFTATLVRGMKEFEKQIESGALTARQAFVLFSSYGFPIELTQELAHDRGIAVDTDAFRILMQEHQIKSRSGAAQKFAGGLADTNEKTTELHTTHHLLLGALQMILGNEVKQRGSNITGERLRIDFSYGEKLTDEQKKEVELIVNDAIAAKLPILKKAIPKDEAEKIGAEHEFGQKYPDIVTVYSVGPKDASIENPNYAKAFSIEFCGGPHVANTGDIHGTFRIAKEKASSAGIRRIRGVLE